MKNQIVLASLCVLLLMAGCTKEKIAKGKGAICQQQHIKLQTTTSGKKEPDCLINVGTAALFSPTAWNVTVYYENAVPNPKSMLVTVRESGSGAIVFSKAIEKIKVGAWTYNFTFPSAGSGPWTILIQSYNTPHLPANQKEHCAVAAGGLNAPNCIDPLQICNACVCTADYDPVCGCDGITYSNSCYAQKAGVVSWTQGACGL